MSLAASEYSVGCAQNTPRYVEKLVRRARQEQFPVHFLVYDLCQKPSRGLFSSAPGPTKLRALLQKFAPKK